MTTFTENLVDLYVSEWPDQVDKIDSETIVSLNDSGVEVSFEAEHTDTTVEAVTVYADGIEIGTFDMRSDEDKDEMTSLLIKTLEIED